LASLAWALLATWLLAAGAPAAETSGALVDAVQKLLPDSPGASVVAADYGQIVFQHAYGLADVDNKAPCTPATNFRIASCSKQFTAACIMLLVDRGKVKLDDTLDKFFPGFPAWGRKITVRHLLSHTSGLPDYENLIPDGAKLQLDDLDVLQLLMDAKEPQFAPGEKWQYSNSGYTLLGLIVEVASGQPFHEFMAKEIFQPLGMTGSVMYVRGLNDIQRRAFGHEKKDGKWVRSDQSLTSAVRGDGGVYTSLEDYIKWLAALDRRQLFSADADHDIFEPHVETDRAGAHYGYGWFIDSYRDEKRIYHNGETHGFRATVQMFPQRRAAVFIQLNGDIAVDMTKLGQSIGDAVIFDRAKPATAKSDDQAALPN
jgi:CubicO group peptidase (beta-lactamase class C family)